jgi:uncharacterized protein YqjF (DUF2071 family)
MPHWEAMLAKPAPTGLAAETTLHHFAMVTFTVDPDSLRKHLHRRFQPNCIPTPAGARRAVVSVVTFLDRDFRLAAFRWLRRSFGQTNYRAYVIDAETGEHVVWFFGTCLDSASVAIPRYVWGLPWHRAHMDFQCEYDGSAARYTSFAVTTRSRWAPAALQVTDSGQPPRSLDGFPDLESGLLFLTHPLRGYFFRHDGSLGSYSVWHERMQPTQGQVTTANYPLLDQLGLVEGGSLQSVHSVLIQPAIDFTIYLPPVKV